MLVRSHVQFSAVSSVVKMSKLLQALKLAFCALFIGGILHTTGSARICLLTDGHPIDHRAVHTVDGRPQGRIKTKLGLMLRCKQGRRLIIVTIRD